MSHTVITVSWATVTKICATLEEAHAVRRHVESRWPALVGQVTVQG